MVQFKSSVGNSNIFVVNRSELKGRWEPLFYSEKYQTVIDKIHSSPWIVKTVKQLAKRIADGPFGSDLKVDEYQMSGVPLLRVSNISTGKIAGKLVYISAEKNEKLKRSKVYPKDVVLTKAGAILGYSAVFPEDLVEGNITSHLVTISCSEDINPYYLSLFFKSEIGQSQIYQWGNKSTRPELNTGEVKKIIVPVPPLEIQKEIVEKSFLTLEIRDRKLDTAKEKLASIDAYFLEKLGINLEATNNDLKERIFIVHSCKAIGKRLDPNFYKDSYQATIDSIQRLPNEKLSKLIKFSSESWDQNSGFDNTFPYIEISEIDILTGGIRNISDVPIGNAPSRAKMVVRNGDILVSLTRPNRGAITLYTGKLSIASTGFAVLRNSLIENERKVLSEYLWYVLRSKICLLQMEKRSTGGNYPAITQEELGNILIPLPSIHEQKQVVAHIRQLRVEAKKLEEEANLLLKNTKLEIEKMILGETV